MSKELEEIKTLRGFNKVELNNDKNMSEEYLEALKTIKIKCHPNSNPSPLVDEALDVVEKALTRLEAIENANPSGALKCLKHIKKYYVPQPCTAKTYDYLEIIEQALIKAQEDKQFIKLILNKPQLLNVFAFDGIHTWEEFEDTFSDEDKEYINTTKEEYEYMRNQLIKRGKIDE